MIVCHEDPKICPNCGSTDLIHQDLIESERIFVCGKCNTNFEVQP
jgi:ribosomal protein S27AE